jgi:SnoaL-like polyketide cyclase
MVDDDVSGLDGEGVGRAVDADVKTPLPHGETNPMKRCGTVVALIICLAAGFTAGFKTALVREHSRLERNKRILRRIHKEVWSNPDLNTAMRAADELYATDFVLHDWTGDSAGRETLKKSVVENRSISPDWNEEVLDMVAEGDKVVSRFLSTGTMKSDTPALPGYQPPASSSGSPNWRCIVSWTKSLQSSGISQTTGEPTFRRA